MRRSFPLALACLTLGVGALALTGQGCGPSLSVQDLCGWLKDEDNCYRRFAEGVAKATSDDGMTKLKPRCGIEINEAGEAIIPDTGAPGEVYAFDNQKPTFGAAADRTKVDVCVLTGGGEGGQIVFDPPLNIDELLFNTDNVLLTPFSFKMLDGSGNLCGSGSYAGTTSFSIGFEAPATASGTGGGGTGTGGTGGSTGTTTGTKPTSAIYSGTFSIAPSDQANIVTTSCPANEEQPNGEAHKFNLYQLDKCTGYKDILPTAEVEVSSGGVGQEGYVRFYVYWPPTYLEGERPADPKVDADYRLNGAKPVKVEYFHCKFPGPTTPCSNSVLDGSETDVDCGGFCPLCCADKKCLTDADCDSGNCAVNSMGFKRCVGDGPICSGGTGGAGGTGGMGGAGGTGGTGGGTGGTGGSTGSCIKCAEAFDTDNPGMLPFCDGSQDLLVALRACECIPGGDCYDECTDNDCADPPTPASDACTLCLNNAVSGCKSQYFACIADQ